MVKLLMVGPGDSSQEVSGGVNNIFSSLVYYLRHTTSMDVQSFDFLSIKKDPFKIFNLISKISRSQLIHVHCSFHTFIHSYQLILPLLFSKLLDKKVIVTYHTGYERWFFKKHTRYLRLLFDMCDQILVPSEHSKKYLSHHDLVHNEKIIVIPNFIDDVFLSNDPSNRGERTIDVVTIAARIDRDSYHTKGIDRFLNVSKKLPTLNFALIGEITDGRLEAAMKKKCPNNVEYLGYVDRNNLTDILGRASIYLQLSRRESFGIAVIEAMSQDVTPIVNDIGALPEVVADSGVVVDADNLEEVLHSIEVVIDGYADMGSPRDRVKELYSIEKHVNRYLSMIEKITEQN